MLNGPHPVEAEDHAVGDHRAAHQTGSATAGDNGDIGFPAPPDDLGDLRGRRRAGDDVARTFHPLPRIAEIGGLIGCVRDDAALAQYLAQSRDKFG